ncbi:MAG: serine/threonine protein kinase [Chloroflexota bacterium]|nr:MAG: serine/threonine protein kinase [Chloroflexota bacterium]
MSAEPVRLALGLLKARLTAWRRQYPVVLALALATATGFLLPSLAGLLHSRGMPVRLDRPVSLLGRQVIPADLICLVLALAICVVILRTRASIRRDLAGGARRLLGALQNTDSPHQLSRGAPPDASTLGAAIACSLFDLTLVLIIQGILRVPFVAVVAAYTPRAWVDGGFVAVVCASVLFMLFHLYRTSRPLAEYLVWVGLDQIAPTSGYGHDDPPSASPRSAPRPGATPQSAEPALSAGFLPAQPAVPTLTPAGPPTDASTGATRPAAVAPEPGTEEDATPIVAPAAPMQAEKIAAHLEGRSLWAGEYEIKEKIGRGAMAFVYKAYARSLDTTVAVKVLSSRLAQEPPFKSRFHAEARRVAALHHPNIIEVHHFGEEDGVPYIAMRYVPGGTLKERLQGLGGPMELRAAARVTAQVASALQHAHEAGCVHLDVKPANVLLGNAGWPLLSDFGISRTVGDAREDDQEIVGTPYYSSPEQCQRLPLDGRSDQYALAVMFYELVTGQPPFRGETPAELTAQHVGAPPLCPRELNPGIPGPVEEAVLRALEKRPEDRFPTVGDFGAALVESVERSQGVQLETKQSIVAVAPRLMALVLLSVVAPLLGGLPRPDLPLFRAFTLNWPINLATALLQVALLASIRWQLIGLGSRLLRAAVDALDVLTRVHVRLGTDAEGPLHVGAWRNRLVGSAESIVNVTYLFLVYQIVGPSLVKTAALLLNPNAETLIATAVVALVLLVAVAIVVKVHRANGSIAAACASAICWGFISAMPMVEKRVYEQLSLQWLAKLIVGLLVMAIFLRARERVHGVVRGFAIPLANQLLRELRWGYSPDQAAAQRQCIEQTCDRLVDVVYFIVGYSIIALPLQRVLDPLIGSTPAAVVIAAGVVIVSGLLLRRLFLDAGVVATTMGVLMCAQMWMALPLFEGKLVGVSLKWAPYLLIAVPILAILFRERRRVGDVARVVVVPAVDNHLGILLPADNEAQAETRRKRLEEASDRLVDLLYLFLVYVVIVRPLSGALAGAANIGWSHLLIWAMFVPAVVSVAVKFERLIAPTLRGDRPAPPMLVRVSSVD